MSAPVVIGTSGVTSLKGTGERPTHHRVMRSFRPDIEALRAVAVLLVVLYHSGVSWLPGGYVGVDVFFVISGFLITQHLYQEISRTGHLRLPRFYARRARRLLPVAALVLVVTLVATWILVSGLRASRVGVDALWSSAFAANIHFARTGVDYQANQDPSPLQHYWSLAAEEQFYLVWPVAMLIVALIWMRGLRRGTRGLRIVLGLTAAAATTTSFLYATALLEQSSTMAYFLTPSRAWELGIGAMVALAAPLLTRARWLGNSAICLLGFVAVGSAATFYTEATPFPGAAALLPTLGAAAIIIAGLGHESAVERTILKRSALQGIGKISYGWYLWHWPLIIIAPLVLEKTLSVGTNLGLSAMALLLAVWTYTALEDPVRAHPKLLRSTTKSLATGLLAVLISVTVASAAVAVAPLAYRTGSSVAEVDRNSVVDAVVSSEDLQVVPGNVDPSIPDAATDKPDLDAADGISCMVSLLTDEISEEPGGSCVAGGTEGGSHTVALVGDSHAYQWEPALREIAVQRDWRLISMTKSGCTLNDVQLTNTMLKRDYVECYAWRQKVMERLAEEKPEMIITTAAIFNPRPGDFTDRWVDGVSRTTADLVALDAPVYVIEDTPYPKRDVPDCLAQNIRTVSECALPIEEAYSDNDRRTRSADAARAAGAKIIDPAAWFCNAANCPPIVGNAVVYSDNSHMTQTYSRTLSTVLAARLPEL